MIVFKICATNQPVAAAIDVYKRQPMYVIVLTFALYANRSKDKEVIKVND